MEFAGKTALITGSGAGIGRSTALALAAEGARLVVVDIVEDAARAVADQITAGGGEALAVVCDVADDTDVADMGRVVMARFGAPDLLINNAFARSLARGMIDTLELEACKRIFDVNVLGNLRVTRTFVAAMEAKRGTHLVDTSSTLVILPSPDAERSLPYLATKGAILGMAYGLAYNMRRRRIGYSLFCPGLTATAPPGWRASPLPGWTNPDIPASPEHAATILLDGLRADRFLICSQAGYDDALVDFARSGHDPFHGYDFAPPLVETLSDDSLNRSE